MSLSLSQIPFCFEGLAPSVIATCSATGVPNASYLSHVYCIDDKHVATSFQFFNKTRANLMENPYAVIKVMNPGNLQSYHLKVKYLRSEDHGPVFEQMAIKLDVIASYEGMGTLFKLKAADIYEVLSVEQLEAGTTFQPDPSRLEAVNQSDLELLRVISDKMSQQGSLEDLFDESMQILHRYLGWSHMILLLAEPDQQTLVTHSSFGYALGGVGAEVKKGEGLIGLCAEHSRLLQVGAMGEGLRYAKAAREGVSVSSLMPKIPLPGILNPASQIAAPLRVQGEFIGVLAVESETKTYWGPKDQLLLSTVANFLAAGIRAFDKSEKTMKATNPEPPVCPAEQDKSLRMRWVPGDDLLFVNDQYLIKNIPAKILWYLLQTYHTTGRSEFSNMELRSEKSLSLPEVKDNLETRLILLRKRLEEHCRGIRLVSTGRGKFRLEVYGNLIF